MKGTIPDEHVFHCSNYLVGLVFDSLAEAFKNAREIQVPQIHMNALNNYYVIQNWLTDSARQISKAGKPVQWTTPLGLPVIQPYHMNTEKQVPKCDPFVWHRLKRSQISTDFGCK